MDGDNTLLQFAFTATNIKSFKTSITLEDGTSLPELEVGFKF